ncbi:hypothetical protein [Sunxiuqinia elliptica]|uniref:Uncharacterized protein n=1 Tax=Sunxiuqinia elliptica TaxID=655355 RepID=A0A1I2MGG5_9BACT|nr:hypothetical protein [Sunxiuqinia elliptica]SFF90572.1 hypothetical protein SAMN05216283_1216 [Sunxiuqinia elliptica]
MTNQIPPISPQTIIDVIFAATASSSSDEKSNQMGTFLFKDFLNNLKEENKGNVTAINYLNNIIPVIGSTLRAFNVEKLNYKRKILPLEKLKQGELDEVDKQLNSWPLFSFIKATNNWTANGFKVFFGLLGAYLGLNISKKEFSGELNMSIVLTIILVLLLSSLFVLLSMLVTRWIRHKQVKKIINQSATDLDEIWKESYKKYETSLFDCLVATIRAQEQFYPEILTFKDGHLFPRNDFPYMPPSNADNLTPSPQETVKIIDNLSNIIRSRISVSPGFDKINWLKELCTNN